MHVFKMFITAVCFIYLTNKVVVVVVVVAVDVVAGKGKALKYYLEGSVSPKTKILISTDKKQNIKYAMKNLKNRTTLKQVTP